MSGVLACGGGDNDNGGGALALGVAARGTLSQRDRVDPGQLESICEIDLWVIHLVAGPYTVQFCTGPDSSRDYPPGLSVTVGSTQWAFGNVDERGMLHSGFVLPDQGDVVVHVMQCWRFDSPSPSDSNYDLRIVAGDVRDPWCP